MAKESRRQVKIPKFAVINGRRYKYNCRCHTKKLDCVTPEMWDAVSAVVYKKKLK